MNNSSLSFSALDKYYVSKPYYSIVKQFREHVLKAVSDKKAPVGKKIAKLARSLPVDAMVQWPKSNVYVSVILLLTIDHRFRKIFAHLVKHNYGTNLLIDNGLEEAFDIYFFCDYRYVSQLCEMKVEINHKHCTSNMLNSMTCGNSNTLCKLLTYELISPKQMISLLEPEKLHEMLETQELMLVAYAKVHTEEETVEMIAKTRSNNIAIWELFASLITDAGELSSELWNIAVQHYEIDLTRILKKIRLAGIVDVPTIDQLDQVNQNRVAWLRKIYNLKNYTAIKQIVTVKKIELRNDVH